MSKQHYVIPKYSHKATIVYLVLQCLLYVLVDVAVKKIVKPTRKKEEVLSYKQN